MNEEKLKTFENVPTSVLDDLTAGVDLDAEILGTSKHIPSVNGETVLGAEEITDKIPKSGGIGIDNSVKTSSTKLGSVIQAELAVNLLDVAVPALIVTAIYYVGYKIEKREMTLNSKDKQVIIPAMQSALDAIQINFENPFVNLAFVVSVVYGVKIIEAIPDMKKADRKKPEPAVKATEPIEEIDSTPITPAAPAPLVSLSPETNFFTEWNALLEAIIKQGTRKSKKGAINFLFQNEREKILSLIRKHGVPKNILDGEKDIIYLRKNTPGVNFDL